MEVVSNALSKIGYGDTRRPLLAWWGSRAIYLGPAFALSAHRNAVAVLAIGLDTSFGVARDPLDPIAGYRSCRTAVIGAGTLHHLQTGTGFMAFIYLDSLSSDLIGLLAQARDRDDRAAYDLAEESAVIELLRGVASSVLPLSEARKQLGDLFAFHPSTCPDARIAAALRRLQYDPSTRHNLASMAADADLSPSRFQHLFKQVTGVPLRRYRTWCRMSAVVKMATDGASLTNAAYAAGFASSAHFSAAFREMFGLSPTRLNLKCIAVEFEE